MWSSCYIKNFLRLYFCVCVFCIYVFSLLLSAATEVTKNAVKEGQEAPRRVGLALTPSPPNLPKPEFDEVLQKFVPYTNKNIILRYSEMIFLLCRGVAGY